MKVPQGLDAKDESSDGYLSAWLHHTETEVAAINQAFGANIDSVSKAIYWWGKHGGLRGLTLHEAHVAGVPLDQVVWATKCFGA